MFIPSSLLAELIDQAHESDLIGIQNNPENGQWSLMLIRDQVEVGTKMIDPIELAKKAFEKKVWISVPNLSKMELSVKTYRNQQDEQRDPGIGPSGLSTSVASGNGRTTDELNRVVPDASGSGSGSTNEREAESRVAQRTDGVQAGAAQAVAKGNGSNPDSGPQSKPVEPVVPAVPPVQQAAQVPPIPPAPPVVPDVLQVPQTPTSVETRKSANADFALTKDVVAENRNLKQKALDNVIALELLSTLKQEDRKATEAERFVLARYVGWGGLSKAFRKIDGSFNQGWEEIGTRIETAVSADELKAMALSTLDAFYTSIDVVDAMWEGVKAIGLNPRKIHEPSVGSGIFVGRSPFAKNRFTAVEMEPTTAAIAANLYPEARVINAPYQRVLHKTGPIYDLVIGNPPFGQDRIYDTVNPMFSLEGRNTHGYFFAKSMAKTAPGGIVAMVVSRYLMDAESSRGLRESMYRQSALLGAYRLPDVAFRQNAGTDVVTDVLFFQKRHEPLSDEELAYQIESAQSFATGDDDAAWVVSGRIELPHERDGSMVELGINQYFIDNPDHVLGRLVAGHGMHRDGELGVKAYPDGDWVELLTQKMTELKAEFELPHVALESEVQSTAAILKKFPVYFGNERAGSYVLVQGKDGEQIIGLREGFDEGGNFFEIGYRPVIMNTDERYPEPIEGEYDPFERISKMNYERMLAYLPLRDAVIDILENQVALPDDDESNTLLDGKRAAMSKLYDAFTKRFGLLNRPSNERTFRDDIYASQVLALEIDYQKPISKEVAARTGEKPRPESAEKSRIFTVRTTFPPKPEPSEAADVDSALVISLNYRGGVNPHYMCSLLNRPWDSIREELGDRVCLLADGWYTAEQAASGDVVYKIEQMNNVDMDHVERVRSSEMLLAALPPNKTIDRISVMPGANWIALSIYEDFMVQAFGHDVIKVALDGEGKVTADHGTGRYTGRGESGATFTTDRVNQQRMANLFLLRHAPAVFDYDENDKPILNVQQTELARTRMDALNTLWDKWIKQDPDRCALLEHDFNQRFNRFAEYKGHGDLLTLPDLSPEAPVLRPTQKDGAWRIINGRAVLIDHGVGAGKTMTAIAGAMESIRLGLVNKVMIAVPNGLQGQWSTAALTMYPNANVLVASEKDLESKNRRRFLSRIATDDQIDLIIIPHSSFSMIPRDPDFDVQMIDERIDLLLISLREEEAKGENSKTFKQIQRKIKKERERASKIIDRSSSDDRTIHFGMLGVDMLMVDESQNFKNISYQTSFRNVGGLGNPDGSAKADDCMIKERMIINRGGKVVDMSGTPEANSLAEVYLSQNKMDPSTLERMGIRTFDQWASVFAKVTNEFQFTLSGSFKEPAYLNSFVNLTILQDSLLHFRHSVTIEDVKRLAVEAGLPPIPIPKLAGGKPNVVVVPQTDAQKEIIGYQIDVNKFNGDPIYNEGSILHQVANLPTGRPQKGQKNILTCIGDLNKASLAAQEYLRRDTGDRVPKLDAMTDSLVGLYSRFNDVKGTQIVFLDFSTPKSKSKSKSVNKEAEMLRNAMRDVEIGEREDATDAQVSAREEAEEYLAGFTQTEIDDLLDDDGEWSAYVAAKQQLIEKGIPAHEIDFIHYCATSEQREELFGKMRSGDVRVIFGSTSKMGAGVNVQNRIVGMHMLDAPWRPDQMEQRIGRMLRQGNELMELIEGFEVALNYYVTEGSSDAARYQILENKKRFLDAIRVRDGSDTVDDPEAAAFNPAAIMAAASGNEVLQDRAVFSNALKRVGSLIDAQESERHAQRSRLDRAKKALAALEPKEQNANMAIDIAKNIIENNNRLRGEFEEAVEALKVATADVREEQRTYVKSEQERILTSFGLTSTHANALSKEESEQAAPLAERKEAAKAELEAQGKIWNKRLVDNLSALPQTGKGWIRLTIPGEGEVQFNNTTLGAYAEERIKDMRRQGQRSVELFENMGMKVFIELHHSEIKGTYPVVIAKIGEGDEALIAYRNYLSASLSDGGLELMRMPGEIARIAADTLGEIRRCRLTLEDATGTENSSEELDHQYAWLEEATNSAQSLLRCNVRNWEDGVALMDRLEGREVDADEFPVISNLSEDALKLSMDIAAPHSGFVRAWIDDRDEVLSAISSNQPVPEYVINRMIDRMGQQAQVLNNLNP